jgi:hypothetical protein
MQLRRVQRRRRSFDLIVIAFLVAGLACYGCDIINPDDPVPAYVHIGDIPLSVEPGQGTASEAITEAWFYAGGDFLGAYSLPATIPVIGEGLTEILVFPGVTVNGITATPDIYPFYSRYEVVTDLQPLETTTLSPATSYLTQTQFTIVDGFETANIFVDNLDGDPETFVVMSAKDVFEGERSGYIALSSDHGFIEVASVPIIEDLPLNGGPVYLELNYKNNTELAVGLVGHAQGIPPTTYTVLTLRKRATWNKIYINLTEALIQSRLSGYQLLLRASHDPENTISEIFIDNLKLVHFSQ